MRKPKVAFICVHNSCRSQMAEAISRMIASETFEAFSAGTETAPNINKDAVNVINELFGVDMTQKQRPKLIDDLPPVDIIVTMGCNVKCPWLPSRHREDWGLDDPAGKTKEEFVRTAKLIEGKAADLRDRIRDGKLSIE